MSNEELEKEQSEVVDNAAASQDTATSDAPATEEAPAATAPAADEAAENADAAQDAQTEKAKKPAKVKSEKGSAQGSKLFKLIYYPVLAVVALIMLVFSIVDGVYGYKPKAYGADYYTAVNSHIASLASTSRSQMGENGIDEASDYIVNKLVAGGFTQASEVKSGEEEDDEPIVTVTGFAKPNGTTPAATVTKMTSTLTAELQTQMGVSQYLVGAQITNVLAVIPSTKTLAGEDSSAIIITARYDTRTDTVGAAENGAFVANLIQTLIEYKKNDTAFNNDIVVVFTEDMDSSYGAYAFFNSFDGFNDVVSRAIAGVNLDAYGNGGTLALTDSTGAGLDYLYAYAKVAGEALNSSVAEKNIPQGFKNSGAVAAFGGIPAIQVSVFGSLDKAQSQLDTADNISQSVVYSQASFIKKYIDAFGNTDKTFSVETGREVGFFSYFDCGTIAYDAIASYVIGALIIALFAATITVIAVKKAYSVKKLFTALGVQLLTFACTLAVMFAAYFLVTLMLTGFGVLPIHAITQIRHFNAGILIAAMLIAVAGSFGFSALFKKLFKVTASDCVRGNAILVGIVGAVMCFAAPAYAYTVCWFGMLSLVVLLVSACVKNIFKDKVGFGMDRLFLFVVPAILCMPLMITTIVTLTSLLPLYMLPLTMLLFSALIGSIVPYLDRTKTVFDRLAKKLPKRTIRVQRIVEERVEDRAKKGKFTVRTVKKVENEKVDVNYKTYFGVSVLAVLGVIVALFSGGFGVTFGKTLTAPHTYAQAEYNDAVVYECVIGSDGTSTTQKLVVDDLIAYKYVRYAVGDLEWDSLAGRYTKTVDGKLSDIIYRNPDITKDGSTYTVSTFDGPRATVTITIPSARNITKITVSKGGDDEGMAYEFNNQDTIVLRLPYGYCNQGNEFILEFEGGNPSGMDYEERRSVTPFSADKPLANLDDWNRILNYYDGTNVASDIRGAIVIKRTKSF